MDNKDEKEILDEKKDETIESLEEAKKRLEDGVKDEFRRLNPEATEEEAEQFLKFFYLMRQIELKDTLFSRIKTFLRRYIVMFIINIAIFGLLSTFVEYKKWYDIFIYVGSLSMVSLILDRVVKSLNIDKRKIILFEMIEACILFIIIAIVNANTNFFVFDNLFVVVIYLIISKIIYSLIEFKILMWKIKNKKFF